MKLKILKAKDFYSGMIFIFFGVVAIFEVRHYDMGTAARMGPGYFPYIVAIILVMLGLIIACRSIWLNGKAVERIKLRPLLLVTISVVAFTLLVSELGLIVAILVLVVGSSFGYGKVRVLELILLNLILLTLGVGFFVYFLKVPFKVWP